MNERYDIAIIGSGPAGISAALNAKIRNKRFIIFGSKEISTKLVKAHKINNYLGFYGKSAATERRWITWILRKRSRLHITTMY